LRNVRRPDAAAAGAAGRLAALDQARRAWLGAKLRGTLDPPLTQ